jgi:hypothetical protein
MAGEGLRSLGSSLSGGGFLSTLGQLEQLSTSKARQRLQELQLAEAERQASRAPIREEAEELRLKQAQTALQSTELGLEEAERLKGRAPVREAIEDAQLTRAQSQASIAERVNTQEQEKADRLKTKVQEFQAMEKHPMFKTASRNVRLEDENSVDTAMTSLERYDNLSASYEEIVAVLDEKKIRISPQVLEQIPNGLSKMTNNSLEEAENLIESLHALTSPEAAKKQELADIAMDEKLETARARKVALNKLGEFNAASGDVKKQNEIVQGLTGTERVIWSGVDKGMFSQLNSLMGSQGKQDVKAIQSNLMTGFVEMHGGLRESLRDTQTHRVGNKPLRENIADAKTDVTNMEKYLDVNGRSMDASDLLSAQGKLDAAIKDLKEVEAEAIEAERVTNNNEAVTTILIGDDDLSPEEVSEMTKKELTVMLKRKRLGTDRMKELLPGEALDEYVKYFDENRKMLKVRFEADTLTLNASEAAIDAQRKQFGHSRAAGDDIQINPSNLHGAPAITGPIDEAPSQFSGVGGSKRVMANKDGTRSLGFVNVDPRSNDRYINQLDVPLSQDPVTGALKFGEPTMKSMPILVTDLGNQIDRSDPRNVDMKAMYTLPLKEQTKFSQQGTAYVQDLYGNANTHVEDILGIWRREQVGAGVSRPGFPSGGLTVKAADADKYQTNPMRISEDILEPLRKEWVTLKSKLDVSVSEFKASGKTPENFEVAEIRRVDLAKFILKLEHVGNLYANSLTVQEITERDQYGNLPRIPSRFREFESGTTEEAQRRINIRTGR